jgi:hypothetical protein
MWIAIILVLVFFGFNIFFYLAKGTQGVSDFLGKIIEVIGVAIANLLEWIGEFFKKVFGFLGFQIGDAKSGIDEVSNTIVGAISLGQGQSSSAPVQQQQQQQQQQDQTLQQSLNQSLNQQKQTQSKSDQENYYADDSNSSIQSSKPSSKSGWCFIGEDRGFRSCIQVNQNDKCMSGDIFPSQEICINPKLRS